MAEETLGFWGRLEFFLLSDDKARWKAIGWIIFIVGISGAVDLGVLGTSVEDGVRMMGSLTLILAVFWIGLYCSFGRFPSTSVQPLSLFSRRAVIFQGGLLLAFICSLRLPRLEAREVERELQRASDNPLDPKNAEAAQKALVGARQGFVRIDSGTLRDTGSKFIKSTEQNSGAWPTVQEYLSYRSFLNADSAPILTAIDLAVTPSTGTSKYRPTVNVIPPVGLKQFRAFQLWFAGGYATGDKSARLEPLSKPEAEGSEFSHFIIDGREATIELDGEYMRNVIIRNCDVSYGGGSVKLESVWFINCTFRAFGQSVSATRFGTAILAHSKAVTFTSLL
jgi:hypothetical protein